MYDFGRKGGILKNVYATLFHLIKMYDLGKKGTFWSLTAHVFKVAHLTSTNLEYRIKHLRIQHRFHTMCSRKQQNRHFLGNWCKISVLKMEVAAVMEATVALFAYFINDLHLRVQNKTFFMRYLKIRIKISGRKHS